MRIGSMFARGSCSALTWAALLGVVFALGAGSASAQLVDRTSTNALKVAEGAILEIPFELKVEAAADYGGGSITVTSHYFPDVAGRTDLAALTGSTDPANGEPTLAETGVDMVNTAHVITFEANPSTTTAAKWTRRETLRILVASDIDAEDEIGYMILRITGITTTSGTALTFQDDVGTPGTKVIATSGAEQLAQQIVPGTVTIEDRHEQTFTWSSLTPSTPKEGANATVTLTPFPAPVQYQWRATARTDSTIGYGVGTPGILILDAAVDVSVSSPGTDANRVDDEVELSLYFPGTSTPVPGVEPYSFTFKDIHTLPADDKITWKAYGSKANGAIDTDTEVTSITEGGDPAYVRVTVERGTDAYPSGEDIVVNVMPREGLALDYRTEDAPLTFNRTGLTGTNNSKSVDFKLYALADNDIAMEDLVLDLVATGKSAAANGSGETTAAKPVMLTINDETTPLLTPMTGEMVMETVNAARMAAAGSDDLWTPGEMFELDGEDLFTSDNTVQVAAMSSSGAVGVSTQGGMVMLQAMEVGTSTITITGTVASSFTSTQTVDNIATIEFDLEVDELPLAITLSGPEDMNIAEGMSAMVTATANRAVNADTRVELNLVGGSGSPADYSVEPIMIMNGQTTGTTMLMATEDGMEEAMETLELEGTFGSGMKTNKLTFNIWDAAVPALPIIAQLLLAAFLAVGGYRRYLRRR